MFRKISLPLCALAAAATLGACTAMQPNAGTASIEPQNAQRAMTLTASGVQIYACEMNAQHQLGWVFKSPQATLFDTSGQAVVEHGAGPSWQAQDGSRIVGHVLAQKPSDTPASIPQLLLETHSTAAGTLSSIRFVQRVNTVGGTMPTAPCSAEHQIGKSPYLANYVFYR